MVSVLRALRMALQNPHLLLQLLDLLHKSILVLTADSVYRLQPFELCFLQYFLQLILQMPAPVLQSIASFTCFGEFCLQVFVELPLLLK